MNWRIVTGLSAITALGLALLPSDTVAQQQSPKDKLVGSWIFVSSTTKAADGSPMWGSNPKGVVVFTVSGRYSSHLMRSDRP